MIEATTPTPTTAAEIIRMAEAVGVGGTIGAVAANARSVGAAWASAVRAVRLGAVFNQAVRVAGAVMARRVAAGAVGIRG